MPFSIHMVLLELYYCAVVFSLASVKYWVLVVVWVGAECPQQSAAATVQFTLATSRRCTLCTTQLFSQLAPTLAR